MCREEPRRKACCVGRSPGRSPGRRACCVGRSPGRRACLFREEPREESVLCGEEPREEPREESVLCWDKAASNGEAG